MKKTLPFLFAFIVLFTYNAQAQLPDFGVNQSGIVLQSYQPTANYSGNHIYSMGNWKLDSILDAGTPIILDLFAVWCGPCWTYHEGGELEKLYDSKGWGGTGEVAIFGVEADGSTAANTLEDGGNSKGDWINDVKYPMVNDDDIAAKFNLAYYPTIVMVCPDRTVTEVGQINESDFITALSNCAGPVTNSNDVRVLPIESTNSTLCQQEAITVEMKAPVQNYSNVAISADYDVELSKAGSVIGTKTITVELDPYEVEEVNFGTVTVPVGTNDYTAKITTTNDDVTNDTQPFTISVEAPKLTIADKKLKIEFNFDAYPDEVGFALRKGVPAEEGVVAEWNAADASNSIGFAAINSLSASNSSQEFDIDENGCYFFVVVDAYGDGITYNNPSGEARLVSGNTVKIPGDWGVGTVVRVEFDGIVGTKEYTNMSAYTINPNPVTDIANVSISLKEATDVQVDVVNLLGQTVKTLNLGNVSGTRNFQISTSHLTEGIYLVNIIAEGYTTSQKISVVK